MSRCLDHVKCLLTLLCFFFFFCQTEEKSEGDYLTAPCLAARLFRRKSRFPARNCHSFKPNDSLRKQMRLKIKFPPSLIGLNPAVPNGFCLCVQAFSTSLTLQHGEQAGWRHDEKPTYSISSEKIVTLLQLQIISVLRNAQAFPYRAAQQVSSSAASRDPLQLRTRHVR